MLFKFTNLSAGDRYRFRTNIRCNGHYFITIYFILVTLVLAVDMSV